MKHLVQEVASCLVSGFPSADLVRLSAKASLLGDADELEAIKELVREEDLAPIAMACLPGWGETGIQLLVNFAFDDNQKLKTRTRAIECAICVSQGTVPTSADVKYLPTLWDDLKKYKIEDNISKICLVALREKLLATFEDDYERSSFFLLLGVKATQYFADTEESQAQVDFLLSLMLDNQLALSSSTIAKFASALDAGPRNEEELQKLLTEHPVLLDPFVSELFAKQQLGSDFITDYVIRRVNNEYVLVEIENSTDKLFNKNGSFSSSLIDAIAQVRDFQAWVSDNLSYAQKKLPEIKHPEGLVIIGRSSMLSEIERKRLAEENHSRRGHIKILTYDELLGTARTVHRNIVEKPIVRTSKETKSI